MTSLGLTIRFVFALVGAVLLAGILSVALWTQDHMQRRESALQAHAQLVLQDFARALENRMLLGLPLAQLPDVERLVDAARAQLPIARSVGVVDEKGRIVFSSNPVELGDVLPELQGGWTATGGKLQRAEEDAFWMAINDDDDRPDGAVFLRLPKSSSDRQSSATFAVSLALQAAPLLLLMIVFAGAVGVWLAHTAGQQVAQASKVLEGLGQNQGSMMESHDAAIGLPLRAFAAAVTDRHRLLSEAEDNLGKLDEMA